MIGGGPHFVVGRVPSDWPAALAPSASAHTVGGVAVGPVRIAVFSYPRAVDPIAAYRSVVTRAGFKRYDPATADEGFVAQGVPTVDTFCGASGTVAVMQIDSTPRTRTLAVTMMTAEGSSGCSSRLVTPPSQSREPLTIPPLRAPRGVSVQPKRRAWSDDSEELAAQLDTTMWADSLLTHYAAQLTAAGWKAVRAPSVADGIAAQQLSTRDVSGSEWRGVLLVLTVGDRRDVMLRMARSPRE